MNFVKLCKASDENIWAGTIFRFPAHLPFEPIVDFMLYFDVHSESGFSLVCTSGGKAGNYEGWLPKTALASGNVKAVSRNWLIKNWQDWIYPHTSIDDILMLAHYPEPISVKF